MMNLGFNGWFFSKPFTGIGQYSINLVLELANIINDSHKITVFINSDAILGELSKIKCVDYVVLEKKRYSNDIADILLFEYQLRRKAVELSIDVLHTPYLCSPFLHGNCFRHVVTIHDVIPMIFTLYRGSYFRHMYMSINERYVKKADFIITDSEHSKKDIIKLLQIDPDRMEVISIAADKIFSEIIHDDKSLEVKRKYSLSDDFIFYIGGFDYRKNIKTLLEAYALARKNGLHEMLILGGKFSPSRKQLTDGRVVNITEMLEKLGIQEHVRILGYVPQNELPHIYKMAKFFVFPSLYEGFGLPVLEAMSCGCPVIAGNNSSIPEIVGDAGLLVSTEDSDVLAQALVRVATDQTYADELRKKGIQGAGQFSLRRTAERTMAVYEKVLHDNQPDFQVKVGGAC